MLYICKNIEDEQLKPTAKNRPSAKLQEHKAEQRLPIQNRKTKIKQNLMYIQLSYRLKR